MKNLVFLLGLVLAGNMYSQNALQDQRDTTHKATEGDFVTAIPDVQAAYPGGLEKLREGMVDNITLRKECKEMSEIRIEARFVVEKTGEIGEIKIMKSNCDELNAKVIAAIRKLKKFQPASLNGKPVRQYFLIPVLFLAD